MAARAIHYTATTLPRPAKGVIGTSCGMSLTQTDTNGRATPGEFYNAFSGSALEVWVTNEPADVTCKRCLKRRGGGTSTGG